MDGNRFAIPKSAVSRPFFLVLLFMFLTGSLLDLEPVSAAPWVEMSSGVTEHLRGVWIAQDESAFAVGDGGTILGFNGSAWSTMTSNTTKDLYDVCGSSPVDVAASGMDRVLLYNGASWGSILSTDVDQLYTPVWMPATGGDIFVGVPGSGPFPIHYLYRYDREGTDWGFGVAVGSYRVLAFCGTSDNDVYMATESGDILHTDNALNLSTAHSQPSPLFLTTAWFASSNCSDVFGADELGEIYRFSGNDWTDMNAGTTDTTFYGMGGSSSSDVYAVGIDGSGNGVIWHYNGTSWSKLHIPTIPGLIDVAIGSGIAVGENGRLVVRDYVTNIAAIIAIMALLLLSGAAGF